jgi:hypothetical protein
MIRCYPCGCSATGNGDLPSYCPTHDENYIASMCRLRDACKPFVELVKNTSGRIPTERLSAANWHDLVKAYEATE